MVYFLACSVILLKDLPERKVMFFQKNEEDCGNGNKEREKGEIFGDLRDIIFTGRKEDIGRRMRREKEKVITNEA